MTVDAVVRLEPGGAPCPGMGGKGASLARLVADGTPVPATAVITTDAYRRVASAPALARYLAELAEGDRPPDAADVDRHFLGAEIPDDLADEIVAVAHGLGDRLAVRSSAWAEDLGEQSFAGQYRSLLDVPVEHDALLRAVRLVWASLWHPAPWAYRRAWGIPDHDAAMAVVLMAMVPATHAGVVFTVDPGGSADQMRVEVVEGLGEALVSGAATPTAWIVPRDPEVAAPAGTPPVVDVVRALARSLEQRAGVPLDIEWATDGSRTWIVQSRPVTVAAGDGDGFDTGVDDHELTSEGIGEMLPGVLPPLRWAVAGFLVEESFRSVLSSLGALPPAAAEHRFLRRVRGRAALDLDLLKAAASSIPGASDADIERQYFGDASVTADAPRTTRISSVRALRRDLRAAAARRHARFDGDVVCAVVRALRDDRSDLAALEDRQLLARRLRLIEVGVRAMTAELAVAASAAAAYERLQQVLTRHLSAEEAARQTQLVTRGAAIAGRLPGASRSVFGGPTWEEGGASLAHLGPGRSGVDEEVEAARRALELRLTSDPRWRRTRVLSGQVVDVRLHLIRRMVADASEDLRRRERVKAAALELGGHVRRVHLEAGRRLAERGLLAAEDVELLDDGELRRALLDAKLPPRGLLGRRRRWLASWASEDLLPARFTGRPTPVPVAAPVGDQLVGLAASPGRFTGTAVVVDDPVGAVVPKGAVIVARATDAAWSPLFVEAGAVVVERGGPLSHAAIVARELGVPAVLDLRGATGLLDGRTVTVDGDRGTVEVHPAGGDAAAATPEAVAT